MTALCFALAKRIVFFALGEGKPRFTRCTKCARARTHLVHISTALEFIQGISCHYSREPSDKLMSKDEYFLLVGRQAG